MTTSDSIAHRLTQCAEQGQLGDMIIIRAVKDAKTGEVGFETYINPFLSTRPAESFEGAPESVTWEQVETGEVPLSSFEDNAYINGYYVTDLIGYPTMLEARAEGAAGILLDFIKEHESHSAEQENVGASIVAVEKDHNGVQVYRLSNGHTLAIKS